MGFLFGFALMFFMTVSLKHLIYCATEEEKSPKSGLSVSKLTANIHFWVKYPFKLIEVLILLNVSLDHVLFSK